MRRRNIDEDEENLPDWWFVGCWRRSFHAPEIRKPPHLTAFSTLFRTTGYWRSSSCISGNTRSMSSSAQLTMVLSATTNQEIAEQRLRVFQAKRDARQKSIDLANERKYQLKHMLHLDTLGVGASRTSERAPHAAFAVPPPICQGQLCL
jgi:hypothetical protein